VRPCNVLAFDLGGTRLKAGIVEAGTGSVRAFTTVPTAGRSGAEALDVLQETGARLLADDAAEAVGLSVPGIVDDGRIVALPGKFDGIVGTELDRHLTRCFDLPATVVNDAVAYGAGESYFGAGTGHERVVVITIGTGVGVAVLEHGRPVARGPLGGGILGGQVPIAEPDDGPRDTNDRQGTLEARCAASALETYAAEEGVADSRVVSVYEAAAAGDKAATIAVDRYRGWLARGIVSLAHAHTPSAVVLGGGPMAPGTPVFEGLQALVDAQLWPGYAVDVRLATLGDHASLIGLGHLALEQQGRRT
jgi:glucokinase